MARQYVIVGASAAGIGAAARLRELDPEAVITVLGEESHYAYYRPLLPYLIDGRKTLHDISFWPEQWYAEQRIRLILGARGHRVEPDRKVVELDDGRRFDYDALLLAVGASSRVPDIPGVEAPGAYPLRTVADAEGIAARARAALGRAPSGGAEGAHAVLLGAGLVSLKAGEPLMNLGVRCTFVVASGHPLSRVVDARVGEMVAERLRARGARLLFGREVSAITHAADGSVAGVTLDTGETLVCDLVIVGKGVAPNLDTAQRSGLACHRGVRAGSYLETTAPDVYAAGDCVETKDVVTGGQQVAALWTNAVSMAHIAAYNMVRGPEPARMRRFPGVIGTMNSGVIAGIPIVALGLTDPVGDQYETVTAVERVAGSDDAGSTQGLRKLVFEADRLVGAIFAGRVDRAGVYRSFIETGLPLGPTLRAAAEAGRLTYADVQMRGQKPPYVNYLQA
ncbi:MAG TPA: FAD-dependent oxidoreductase [Thermoleophilia bacterium]|nr:FAD-dependent oxidoreductase [Thermoleophilia bacterium]